MSGLFEVLKPTLEEGEIFNSGELKDKVEQFIDEGHRNIALDLSELKYLYSDAMNVVLNLNRKVLDVSGRLALLSPSKQVRQILESSGVYNFLKVYDTEDDLIRSSEDIIMQTSSFSLAALKRYQETHRPKPPQKPKSEYDDFRSEIESAMGPDTMGEQRQPEQYTPPPPQSYEQPSAPEPDIYTPSNREKSSYETSQPPRREPEPYEPPSRPQQPEPTSFKPPSEPPREEPRSFEPPSRPSQPEPAAFEPAPPPPPQYEPQTPDFEAEQEPPPQKAGERSSPPKRIDRWADDADDEFEPKKKSSFLPVIVIILIIAILGGAGYFFGPQLFKMVQQSEPTTEAPAVSETPEVPQLPVETPPEMTDSAGEETEDIEEASTAPVKKPSKPAPKRAPRRTVTRQPKRRPTTPSRPVTKTNRLTITSVPSGAQIKIDNKTLGTTPYRWEKPDVYGTIKVTARKEGFVPKTDFVQYEGGIKEHIIRLEKKPEPVAARPSTPAPSRPEPKPSKPAPAARPSTPSPAPAASKPEPTPAPSARAGSSTGEPATIFISSLPPIADVYMDGQHIGKTNRDKLKVRSGTHTMKFSKGGKETIKEMTFQPGNNPSRLVRIP
ncbi:MAG: PEGA domain-containing protein [Chitinivibrionales bacterium]|nr:PEGA domain-containing protein [Chitinivibrionales bacterium]